MFFAQPIKKCVLSQRRSRHLRKLLAPLRCIYAHGFFGNVFNTEHLLSLFESSAIT